MFGYCSSQMGAGGWLLMIGLWASFLALVVWAVARLFPSERRRPPQDDLDRQLAVGEIDIATYRRAREALTDARPATQR